MVAYTISLSFSYVPNKPWSFQQVWLVLPAITECLTIFAVACPANLLTTFVLVRPVGVDSYLAHAVGAVGNTCSSFVGSRYIAFKLPTEKRDATAD